MLNRIVLVGRLVRDPELRHTKSGTAFASFTLAVDRPFKSQSGQKETDFIGITAWRQLGELCAQYLRKGRLAAVDGRLEIQEYEKDGERRRIAQVVADNVRFLEGGGEKKNEARQTVLDEGVPIDITDDDLPF